LNEKKLNLINIYIIKLEFIRERGEKKEFIK